MNYLFVHQNFPGQYLHLACHLARDRKNQVVFITQRPDASLPGVKKLLYTRAREVTPLIHHYLRDPEAAVLNAQAVARVAYNLKKSGFVPDVMLGHNGWGEIWYLKDVFPQVPLVGYFEFFYQTAGADTGFDPSDPPAADTAPRLRTKNMGNLLGLHSADVGQTPTRWQQSTYPAIYQPKLEVMHEGIRTEQAKPDPNAIFEWPASATTPAIRLQAGDEVLTYVARNLEPYRGFPSFMRSLPTILKQRPQAQVLIVGGDLTSYGGRLPAGESYKQRLIAELGDTVDWQRVHFLGKLPYAAYLRVLQVSRVHVYLTYPFVLSWSMLEAMACGCLVVGSKTAPVEEVIRNGENGLLVDFFAPEEIAEKLVHALHQPAAFAPLRENARQTILDRYDLHTRCLPAQLDFLRRVLA